MAISYRCIPYEVAVHIQLIMADVDGTLSDGDSGISSTVSNTIQHLERQGVIIGLVSGRTDGMLCKIAGDLGISGPVIAENGGTARLTPNGRLMDLGYSREPAVRNLEMLVKRYGKKIRQRQDNLERYIDVVFWADGVDTSELRNKLQGVQLLDSGYILHMMQVGISKGNTVSRILGMIGYNRLTASEVMAIGDSTTDISLFQQIPESVLVLNPIISQDKKELLFRTAKYVTDHENGQGFTELCEHIIKARCR